jgi:hypothetical protein
MTTRLTKPTNPEHSTEHVLWTLRKGRRLAQARTPLIPIGNGQLELRIYVGIGPTVDVDDLLWSVTLKDGRDLGALSEERKAAFLERGWIEVDWADDSNVGKPS